MPTCSTWKKVNLLRKTRQSTAPIHMFVGLTVWRLADGKRFTVYQMRSARGTNEFVVMDNIGLIEPVDSQGDFTADPSEPTLANCASGSGRSGA